MNSEQRDLPDVAMKLGTLGNNVPKVVPSKNEIPSALESVLGAFNIMQTSALAKKMQHRKPDIYVRPDIQNVRMFDFGKIEEIFLQAAPAADLLRKQLKGVTVA
jgi:NTE family protein